VAHAAARQTRAGEAVAVEPDEDGGAAPISSLPLGWRWPSIVTLAIGQGWKRSVPRRAGPRLSRGPASMSPFRNRNQETASVQTNMWRSAI
jgi:hypothetical protein